MNKVNIAITLGVLVVVVAVGGALYGEVTSDSYQNELTNQSEWCLDHGGEIVNIQSVTHGGRHCYVNDTAVHMWKLSDAQYPENVSAMKDIKYGTHESTPYWGLGQFIPLVVIMALLMLTVYAYAIYW